jgi:hypothetical protein
MGKSCKTFDIMISTKPVALLLVNFVVVDVVVAVADIVAVLLLLLLMYLVFKDAISDSNSHKFQTMRKEGATDRTVMLWPNSPLT